MHFYNRTPYDVTETLRRSGYQYIGGGCFSDCFRKGEASTVVKVNRRLDPNSIYYVWSMTEGAKFPEAPRISRLWWLRGECYAVRMEYLEPSYGDPWDNKNALVQSPFWRAFKSYVEGKGDFSMDGDYGNENIRQRPNGQLVYTDPFC